MKRRCAIGIGLALGAVSVLPKPLFAQSCGQSLPESIQISLSALTAASQSFHAYRILTDDTVHSASWSGQKRLISLGAPTRIPGLGFAEVRRMVAQALDGGPSQGGSGQFSNWIEVSDFGAERTLGKVLHAPPAAIVALGERLQQASLRRDPPGGGLHVWTNPVPSAGPRDLSVPHDACDDPVAAAIARSLASGAVAVPLESDDTRFLDGENANRIVFIAEIAGRLTQFGVLHG